MRNTRDRRDVLTYADDPAFWRGVHEFWERDPAVMRFAEADPLTLASVFEAVTHMPERTPSDRFWLARTNTPTSRQDFTYIDLDLLGPQPSDLGFAGFFARMQGRPFGINIHRIGAGHRPIAGITQAFGANLTHVPDRPEPTSWMADTFFGTYPATPFGIHRDPASVFSFVLQGRRRYCFWPMDAFAPGDPALYSPDMAVISDHLGSAEVIEAGPGDLVYWPSNRWHVVLSDGQPFVAAQVSAYFRPEDVDQEPPSPAASVPSP